MNFRRTLCIAAVAALSQLVSAAPGVSPQALGHVDATVDFCARVDSKSAASYKAWGKGLFEGVPDKELADARNSGDYRETYDAIAAALAKVPAGEAVGTCRAALTENNK